MIRHEGRFPARLANDLRGFYEGCDNLWAPVSAPGSGAAITGDVASPYSIVPSGLTCNGDCSIGITGYMIGSLPTAFESVADKMAANSVDLPRWNGANFWDELGSIGAYTTAANAVATNCASPCSSSYTVGQAGVTDRLLQYNPNASAPGTQFIGNQAPAMTGTGYPSVGTTFAISASAFGIGDLLQRMKGLGATCVAAHMEVKFSGLAVDTWSFEAEQAWPAVLGGSPSAPDLEGSALGAVNGVTVLDYERATDGTVTRNDTDSPGASSSSGALNFVLMGKAPRSASVVDIDGNATAVETDEFSSLGASVSVSATSGAWAMMDATALVNALLGYSGDASEFFLFPSLGNPLPGNPAGLAPYLASIQEQAELENAEKVSDSTYKLLFNVSGTYAEWTGLTIGTILGRFRLPSGILQDFSGPLLIQPPRETA